MFVKHVPEHPFDHITNAPLRISNTNINGHLCNIIQLLSCIITHQNVSNLRAVAMCNNQIVTFINQENQVFECKGSVFFLFINSSDLVSAQESIPAKGNNCQLLFHNKPVNVFCLIKISVNRILKKIYSYDAKLLISKKS